MWKFQLLPERRLTLSLTLCQKHEVVKFSGNVNLTLNISETVRDKDAKC